jgi:hypothetical protein
MGQSERWRERVVIPEARDQPGLGRDPAVAVATSIATNSFHKEAASEFFEEVTYRSWPKFSIGFRSGLFASDLKHEVSKKVTSFRKLCPNKNATSIVIRIKIG